MENKKLGATVIIEQWRLKSTKFKGEEVNMEQNMSQLIKMNKWGDYSCCLFFANVVWMSELTSAAAAPSAESTLPKSGL